MSAGQKTKLGQNRSPAGQTVASPITKSEGLVSDYPLSSVLIAVGLGLPELLVILLIVILIFGANKLPQLGRGVGSAIKNFKDGIKDDTDPKSFGMKDETLNRKS